MKQHTKKPRSMGMGQYQLASGNYDEVIAAFDRSGKASVMYFYYVAAVHAKPGNTSEAFEFLQKAFDAEFCDFAGLESSSFFASVIGTSTYEQMAQDLRD